MMQAISCQIMKRVRLVDVRQSRPNQQEKEPYTSRKAVLTRVADVLAKYRMFKSYIC